MLIKSEAILPPKILADWFKTNLVIDAIDSISMQKDKHEPLNIHAEKDKRIQYLGNNQKQIAIIVNDSTALYLEERALQFLSNILQACTINLGDIALINIYQQDIEYTQVKKILHAKWCILFGVEPSAIKHPIDFHFFDIQQYDDMMYMYAPALQIMNEPSAESKLLKTKLWACLQKFFGDKKI